MGQILVCEEAQTRICPTVLLIWFLSQFPVDNYINTVILIPMFFLLHSIIIWLPPLSPYSLHLIYFFFSSILALTKLVLRRYFLLLLILIQFLSFSPLKTVARPLSSINITVIFMFLSFFISLARSGYLFSSSLSFNFTLWSTGTTMSTIRLALSCFCW